MRAAIKKAVKAGLIVLVIFFIITEGCIYRYLKLYGYGIDELLGTTLVYFHLSQGFTVNSWDEHSVFIGRHDYIYDEMFEKNGYYQVDRMGEVGFYHKAVQPFDFNIISTPLYAFIMSLGLFIHDSFFTFIFLIFSCFLFPFIFKIKFFIFFSFFNLLLLFSVFVI